MMIPVGLGWAKLPCFCAAESLRVGRQDLRPGSALCIRARLKPCQKQSRRRRFLAAAGRGRKRRGAWSPPAPTLTFVPCHRSILLAPPTVARYPKNTGTTVPKRKARHRRAFFIGPSWKGETPMRHPATTIANPANRLSTNPPSHVVKFVNRAMHLKTGRLQLVPPPRKTPICPTGMFVLSVRTSHRTPSPRQKEDRPTMDFPVLRGHNRDRLSASCQISKLGHASKTKGLATCTPPNNTNIAPPQDLPTAKQQRRGF